VPPFIAQCVSANSHKLDTNNVIVVTLLTTEYKLNYNKNIYQGLKEATLEKTLEKDINFVPKLIVKTMLICCFIRYIN
jgi:hypothetical protein